MDKSRLKEQVETIREAFGYINRFKNETFVIKIDGSLLSNPFFPILIRDLALLHKMGIRVVLVPGAKPRIDEVLATYNLSCQSVDGVRISPPEAIPFIKMAAFDVSNKIMTMLAENNTSAVIGNWVRARAIGVRDGVDFQSSGQVDKLQTETVRAILAQGLAPIFPNIGWSAKGRPYNISSNELALTLARELHAAKLFFLTAGEGISGATCKAPSGVYVSSSGVIAQMNVREAGQFLDLNAGSDQTGQLELVSLAYKACTDGVRRVHIVDGRVEGMALKEIFSNRGLGTLIYANQLENIRPMTYKDIAEVLRLMENAVEEGMLVARNAAELEEHLDRFVVYEVDGTVHGCGSLIGYPDKSGEIAGVAVDAAYANMGIGKKIIAALIERGAAAHLKRLFILTTQSADWFEQLGFVEGDREELPEQKRQSYNHKRNSRVMFYPISRQRTRGRIAVE
jgi:amino-acid N-acetyltransferase